LKINAASELRNFKLLHAAKLEFLGFNPPISIAASKPKEQEHIRLDNWHPLHPRVPDSIYYF
jgi:hypothetical protein